MLRKISLAVIIVAAASTIWVLYDFRNKPVATELADEIRKVVQRTPQLKPMLDHALSDGKLTMAEVSNIVKAAEEQKIHSD